MASQHSIEEVEVLRPATHVGDHEGDLVVAENRLQRFVLLELRPVGRRVGVLRPEPGVRIGDVDHDPHAELDRQLHAGPSHGTVEAEHRGIPRFGADVDDPDTWFQTKYADASVYGTKLEQYEPLEAVLRDYQVPFMVAHMGGWPEDLDFLDGLLARHPLLHLDASATKWIVREVSRHEPAQVRGFLDRWRGRILFGSDIVTLDSHLESEGEASDNEMDRKAGSLAEAFDLYASRYWALRTLWETGYDGESPIADPDLALVDPEHHSELDAPRLRGMDVPEATLVDFYRDAARGLAAKLPLA